MVVPGRQHQVLRHAVQYRPTLWPVFSVSPIELLVSNAPHTPNTLAMTDAMDSRPLGRQAAGFLQLAARIVLLSIVSTPQLASASSGAAAVQDAGGSGQLPPGVNITQLTQAVPWQYVQMQYVELRTVETAAGGGRSPASLPCYCHWL